MLRILPGRVAAFAVVQLQGLQGPTLICGRALGFSACLQRFTSASACRRLLKTPIPLSYTR